MKKQSRSHSPLAILTAYTIQIDCFIIECYSALDVRATK